MKKNIRAITFDIQDISQIFLLKNSNILTLNAQLYLLFFVDKVLGNRISEFTICLDSRFLHKILSIFFNIRIKPVVGSEVITPIFSEYEKCQRRLYIVGLGANDVQLFKTKVGQEFPNLDYVLDTITIDNEGNPEDGDLFYKRITDFDPSSIILCVGSPKQEKLSLNLRDYYQERKHSFRFIIGLGSSLDVYIGKRSAVPEVFKTLGMEWLWRSLTSARMLKRNLRSIRIFKHL